MESKVSNLKLLFTTSCRVIILALESHMINRLINNQCNNLTKSLFPSGKCKFFYISYIFSADQKANKDGAHRSVYWVKKKEKSEDGTVKGEKWTNSSRYVGDWRDNCKEGFGIQYYKNGDKYEGMWAVDKKHG